jgi:hypothetical protein
MCCRSSVIGLIKFITSNESSLVKKMNLFSVALQVYIHWPFNESRIRLQDTQIQLSADIRTNPVIELPF